MKKYIVFDSRNNIVGRFETEEEVLKGLGLKIKSTDYIRLSIDLSDKLENCKDYHEFDRRPPYYIFICHNCPNLETLVGNHTETDNVRLFIGYKGLKTGYSTDTLLNLSDSPRINLATVNAIIRGVGSSPDRKLTLILPEPVKSQVTEEYKKILESKNWKII